MDVFPAKTDLCQCCEYDVKKREQAFEELENKFSTEKNRIDQTSSRSEKQRKMEILTKYYHDQRKEIEKSLFGSCLKACVRRFQGGRWHDGMSCETCPNFQEELTKSKMDVFPAKTDLCQCCEYDVKKREQAFEELEKKFSTEKNRIDQTSSRSEKQRKMEILTKNYHDQRKEIEKSLFGSCLKACVRRFQGGTWHDTMSCETCPNFQEELTKRDKLFKELEANYKKTRSELEEWKKKHQVFRERMSIEASVEIGTSGEIFEDISNPCRESELRSSYNRMRTTMWPKCIKEIEEKIKASRKESVDKNEEKKQIKRMIKEVFIKAAKDMMEKKMTLKYFFKISDTTVCRKQIKCFEMAVQSLQLKIFWEDCTHYQDMYKQLGHSSPDFLCEIADQCYKQGCLMALHNPPLTLDWDNSDDAYPFPPITKNDGADI